MTRCSEKCGKQWRPKQRKLEWQKQKKEKEKKKQDKKVAKEQEIQDKEEEAARLEEEKKLVPEQFYRQIKMFRKKASERCYKLHSACISTTSGPIFTN